MRRPYYLKSKTLFLLLCSFILLVFSSAPVIAADKKLISMDFDNADIRVVIKFISELTGKNIIIDSQVKGNVTVISPTKITVEEAYKVFQSILEVNNFSAVQSGSVIKIVPKPDASKSLTSTRVGRKSKNVAKDDRVITQIIPLDYAASPQVRAALAPLISKNGLILDYPESNMLIITDLSSNIFRLMSIIEEIDIEDVHVKMEVIKLVYAEAESFSKQLSSIFPLSGVSAPKRGRGAASAVQSPMKIIPYERTNSIIVVADDDELKRIKELISQLDVETQVEEGEIHVYYVQNGVADEMSKVLSSMVQSRGRAPAAGAKGVQESLPITGSIAITPDKATNSLVITASPRDFRVIKTVIEKLDIRRRQVYVEATIMEISLDKQRDLGFEFRGTSDPTSGTSVQAIGGTTFGGIEAVSQNPFGMTGQGLVVGAVDGTIKFGSREYLNIGALVRALETESGVNVLSTPHLLTTNNEEAEIIIGENVPFITSRSTTTSGNPIETIERKDVGIKLKITPQVNESDFIKLDIFQEISNVKDAPLKGASDLITTKRSAKTTVVARDSQTVAIGGLIKDNEYDSASKVPCLGDLPLLGMLFRYTQKKKEKTNLLIFLTPQIIRDPSEIESITDKKMDDINNYRDELFPSGEMKTEPGDRQDEKKE